MDNLKENALTVRPIRPEDYAAIAPLWNSVYTNDNYTPDEFAYMDGAFEAPCKFARFVAILDGQIVGACNYAQYAGQYHPQRFMTNVFVAKPQRNKGIGEKLYRHLLTQLEPFDPVALRAMAREDDAVALSFAAKRGFVETSRDWESVLDMSKFDPEPYGGLGAKLAAQNIRLVSFPDWGVTAQHEQMFYDFFSRVRKDVPHTEPVTDISFDHFKKTILDAPDYFAGGVFFALTKDRPVGMTMFWRSESVRDLYTGLTAVDREFRSEGVATALKVKALRFAEDYGAPKVFTDNATTNTEMVAVNDKLGFKRLPAWLNLKKETAAL